MGGTSAPWWSGGVVAGWRDGAGAGVTFWLLVSGHYDYLIEAIATDLEAFSLLVRNKIRCLPGVKEIATSFSLKEVKPAGDLPVSG
jgi:DNA-binding Lrp family transcriptional regulator